MCAAVNAQVPQGYASLEQIPGDEVRWPGTTLIDNLEWCVNVGAADPPRRVVLIPTSTTQDPITTLTDLREGAQRIGEGEGLIRVRYPGRTGLPARAGTARLRHRTDLRRERELSVTT